MAFDILYIEDDYIDAHYFAGTYAGASIVASTGTVTVNATIVTATTASASITCNATVGATASVRTPITGAASITANATTSATGIVGLGILGSSAITCNATIGATGSKRITGAVDSDVIATSVTVAGRRLTETALVASAGTIQVSAGVKRISSAQLLTSSAETSIASVTHRGSFAIGTGVNIPGGIGSSYEQNEIAVPNVLFDVGASLNKLYLDDYAYIIPAETREYKILAETREYKVKE